MRFTVAAGSAREHHWHVGHRTEYEKALGFLSRWSLAYAICGSDGDIIACLHGRVLFAPSNVEVSKYDRR